MGRDIVICDDETPLLNAAKIKLSGAGFTVHAYEDGQAAWEHLENEPTDLLITDLQMPRLNGVELCRRVRATPHLATLPIIMMTAKGYEEVFTSEAQACSLAALVTKPFSPRELVKRVEGLLAGSDAAIA